MKAKKESVMRKENVEILIVLAIGTFVLASLVAPLFPGSGTNQVMTGGISGNQQPTVVCSDSDGGIDFETKGKCTDFSTNEEFTDYCEGSIVVEYRCSTQGCINLAYKCPYGCAKGVCLPQLRV
jgi:hypothetical protein